MKVELINSMGGDLSIVNAARVSYGKESEELNSKDRALIHRLLHDKHGTPFEMVQFQFRIMVPIGVAREWFRHRIGSFNEISTRYVKMEPEFYIPKGSAIRTQSGKSMDYTFKELTGWQRFLIPHILNISYSLSYQFYLFLLSIGSAKELARNVLPLGLYTEFIWSVNLRSLFNFLELRTDKHALFEIQQCAWSVYEEAFDVAPTAFAAWSEELNKEACIVKR